MPEQAICSSSATGHSKLSNSFFPQSTRMERFCTAARMAAESVRAFVIFKRTAQFRHRGGQLGNAPGEWQDVP